MNAGSIVVEIIAEATRLNQGLKEAEDKVKATTGKITDYANKIGLTMAAAGTAIIGAYGLIAKSSADYAEEIVRVSERTGIATERLSQLKYVAEQSESSFESVSAALRYLNKNIYEAQNGSYAMNMNFRILGITIKDDLTGKALSADKVFLQIADRFKGLSSDSEKTALAMQIFGRQGEAIIPVLNLGSDGIKRLSSEADRLGITLSAENAKSLDAFGDRLKSLHSALGGLWLSISEQIVPALTSFIKQVTDVIVKVREWSNAHPDLSNALTKTALALGALLLIGGTAILTITNLTKAIIEFTLAVKILSPALTVLGQALAIVGAAFAGWKIGRVLSEMTGLDNALSGDNGLFTKMWEWLDKNEKKVQNIYRIFQAISTFGFSEGLRLGKKITGATDQTEQIPENQKGKVELGRLEVSPKEDIDNSLESLRLLDQHNQKVKELNDLYMSGLITLQQYYDQMKLVASDGIQMRQEEKDLIDQSINLELSESDALRQRIDVYQQTMATAQQFYGVLAQARNQDLMNQQQTMQSATGLLQTFQSYHHTVWSTMFDFVNMGIQKFSQGFTQALTAIIMHTKTAGQAFKEFGLMMIQSIVEFIIQYAIQALIAATIGAWITSMISKMAGSLANAWAPAAILASIATYGAAAGIGTTAAIGSTAAGMGVLKGLTAAAAVKPMAEGGSGLVTSPTLFLAGEAGPEYYNFTPINQMQKPGHTITINIDKPVISSELDIDDLAERLGGHINRKLRRV